jgi:hypothetical protein
MTQRLPVHASMQIVSYVGLFDSCTRNRDVRDPKTFAVTAAWKLWRAVEEVYVPGFFSQQLRWQVFWALPSLLAPRRQRYEPEFSIRLPARALVLLQFLASF